MFSSYFSLSPLSSLFLPTIIIRAPLDAFCSDASTVSGVDKYISLARLRLFARVLLISSLNPVNVSDDRIRSVTHFILTLPIIPTNWSLSRLPGPLGPHPLDFLQLSSPTSRSLIPGALILVMLADFRCTPRARQRSNSVRAAFFSLSRFALSFRFSLSSESSAICHDARYPRIICRNQME